jgi:glycosyltransferase involved in cell wall biosynthesis
MKFYCLLPLRDEADIIGQCLERLLTWADGIFIFDTGSVDNTWEIVLEYASKDNRIKPIKKDPVYFSETKLRGYIFHKAREVMKEGDWFLRVDADEFHYIKPSEFIKERLHKHETIVYHQYYNFALTEGESKSLQTIDSVMEERKKNIFDRRRYYKVSLYSEPRLCKFRQSMKWPDTVSFPYNAGFVARERLPILHYPNRDPLQMDRRCKLRAVMLADKENRLNWSDADNHYWLIDDWRKFLIPDNDPELLYWEHGTSLKEVRQLNHLTPLHKRILQRIVHTSFLPFLDKRRASYSENSYPQKINQETITILNETLSHIQHIL